MAQAVAPATERQQAPYAAPANVMGLIARYRDKSLPSEPFTPGLLVELSIPAGNSHRTLRALEFLGLLDEAGEPTQLWRQLSAASDNEFPTVLEGIVRSAYKEVFDHIDPAKDSQLVVGNFFRKYEPKAQRDRMVTLFLSLCREAAIPIVDAPRKRSSKAAPLSTLPRIGRPPVRMTPTPPPSTPPTDLVVPTTTHPLITGLFKELPAEWTSEERARWLAAVPTVVDLIVKVKKA